MSSRGTVHLSTGPAGRFGVRASLGLAGVVVAGVVFLLILGVVRGPWTPLEEMDRAVARHLNGVVADNDILVNVLRGVTQFGGRNILTLVLVVGVGYLLIRGQRRLAVYALVTSLGALVLDPVVKLLVERIRPVVDAPVAAASGPGFPSGHALGSLVSYGVLVLVFLPTVRRRYRWPVLALVAGLVALVGLTRVALGVHYVTDVVGGWALGVAWLGVSAAAFRRWRAEAGLPVPPATEGLAPDAAPALAAAPGSRRLPHPVLAGTELAVAAVLVVGVVFGAGVLVTSVLADTAVGRADRAVVAWFADHRTPPWTAVMEVLNAPGSTGWVITATVAACGLALAVFRSWRPVVFLCTVMAGEIVVFLITSTVVTRARPHVEHLQPDLPPTASFPSGHVAGTMCVYGAIAVLVWRAKLKPALRWTAVSAAVTVTAAVAVARLYRGVHHPTDIAGSLLLGGLWLAAAWLVLIRTGQLGHDHGSPRPVK